MENPPYISIGVGCISFQFSLRINIDLFQVSLENKYFCCAEAPIIHNHNCDFPEIGQLPRVSGEDPERIRVDSVFETSVCSLFL